MTMGGPNGGEERKPLALLGPLAHTDFRRLWAAVVVTQLGDWIHVAALGWYVLELGGNAAEVTGVAAASLVPQLLFTLAGGVAADRWAKRNVLRVIALVQFGLALAFALLVAFGLLNVAGLALFAFFLGIGTAVWQPIYLSFVGDLVPRTHLEGSMGLSMGALYTARTVGPALAGVIIASAGTEVAFFVNAATYLAPVLALMFVTTHGLPTEVAKGTLALLKRGVRAVARDTVLAPLWLLTAALSLLAMPVFALLPVFVVEVFAGGALTLGALLTAAGLGQLLGAAALTLGRFVLSRVQRSGLLQLLGYFLMGALVVGFGLSDTPITASVAIFGFNFVYGFLAPRVNAIVQSRTEAERGTAQALFLLVFGLVPIGQVVLGWVAVRVGTSTTIAGAGVALVAVAFVSLISAADLRAYSMHEE